MKVVSAAILAFGCLGADSLLADAQDVARGKAIFNQCMACHQLDANMVGPKLKGVIGRKAGTAEGFDKYSGLMKAASETGLVWSEAEIVDYLKNPTEYLSRYANDHGRRPTGQSRMLFKLWNEQQRRDVVAYLASENKAQADCMSVAFSACREDAANTR